MKPSELFVAKISPDEKSILVSGYQGDQLHFLGSNLTVNVRPGDYVNYFTIHPAENQEGIVAVSATTHRYGIGKYAQTFCFFLSVTWKEGKPRIDLENPWLPTSGRIGQVGHSFVEIQIGNRYFTNYEYRKGPSTILLNDPNLLCRYLIGEVKAIDVIAAAAEPKFEESARKRLEKSEADNADLRGENYLLKRMVAERNSKALIESYMKLGRCADALAKVAEKPWYRRIGKLGQATHTFRRLRSSGMTHVESIARELGISIEW